MADLPILQKAAEAYLSWQNVLPTIPRLVRYGLGMKIDNLFTDMIESILQAGYAAKDRKGEIVRRASAKMDSLKFFLKIAWAAKALDNKKYIAISEPLSQIGKMLGGWSRSLNS